MFALLSSALLQTGLQWAGFSCLSDGTERLIFLSRSFILTKSLNWKRKRFRHFKNLDFLDIDRHRNFKTALNSVSNGNWVFQHRSLSLRCSTQGLSVVADASEYTNLLYPVPSRDLLCSLRRCPCSFLCPTTHSVWFSLKYLSLDFSAVGPLSVEVQHSESVVCGTVSSPKFLLLSEEAGVQPRQNHSVRSYGQTHPALPSVHSAAAGEWLKHRWRRFTHQLHHVSFTNYMLNSGFRQ